MPARDAREKTGLSLEQAASRARVSVAYLRQLERNGRFSYGLAERLSRLYQCNLAAFVSLETGSSRT